MCKVLHPYLMRLLHTLHTLHTKIKILYTRAHVIGVFKKGVKGVLGVQKSLKPAKTLSKTLAHLRRNGVQDGCAKSKKFRSEGLNFTSHKRFYVNLRAPETLNPNNGAEILNFMHMIQSWLSFFGLSVRWYRLNVEQNTRAQPALVVIWSVSVRSPPLVGERKIIVVMQQIFSL